MAAADLAAGITTGRASLELAQQWRRFTRTATIVAVLASPVELLYFHEQLGWSFGKSLAATVGVVVGFRGLLELVVRRFIPWPSLVGTDDARLREDDMLGRRRSWFWRRRVYWAVVATFPITIVWAVHLLGDGDPSWWAAAGDVWGWISAKASDPTTQQLLFSLPIFFFFNFIIFMARCCSSASPRSAATSLATPTGG